MSHEPTPRELEQEIEAQREELAATVDQLAAKVDVKARANARLARTKSAVTTDSGAPRPELIVAGALAVVVVLAVWWRRAH
ncbi:DUF3618 domain-containing protein [Nocardioides sp.]|uniref:DUF3618 domain-containing protein n=1 Tax=Nocardioides sp. TaxID=35761 RepID=UPI003D11C714